jgi:hypothetical protein
MQESTNIAFKEWAVVVDALGRGEQILILRKGGIREKKGAFHVDHREFWLLPTQYHEGEKSVIPAKRPVLRELAANAPQGQIPFQYYAVAEDVVTLASPDQINGLQGRHIWTEQVLRDRFEFGRERGLHALIVRVYQRPEPIWLPTSESYGGCKSWVELEQSLGTVDLAPVLDDATFANERDQILERLNQHALAHP